MKHEKYCKECGDKFKANRVYNNVCASCIEVKYGDIRAENIESANSHELELEEIAALSNDFVE